MGGFVDMPMGGGRRGNFRGRGSFGNNDAYATGASNYDDEEDSGPTESTHVTIPKEMAGAIIGPGGSRVRKIRAESRATITIDEPVQGSDERIITISGNQRSIQT